MTLKLSEEIVTPRKAKQWLESNAHNRPINKRLVIRYAADMRNGLWMDSTGEPFIFDRDGRLTEGQHRLLAIAGSGVSIKSVVVRGTDPDTFRVIGSGSPRRISTVLAMAGVVNATLAGGTAYTVLAYDHPEGRTHKWHTGSRTSATMGTFPTPKATSDFAVVNNAGLQAAIALVRRMELRKLRHSSIVAAMFVILRDTQHSDYVSGFVEGVASGADLSPSDARLFLRNQVLAASAAPWINTQAFDRQARMALVIAAWNRYVNDMPVKGLVFTADSFPMEESL